MQHDILTSVYNEIDSSLNMLGLYDTNDELSSYIVYAKTDPTLTKNSVLATVNYNFKGYEYNKLTNNYVEIFINSSTINDIVINTLPQLNGLTIHDITDIHKANEPLSILSEITFSNYNVGAIVHTSKYMLVTYINYRTNTSNIIAIDYRPTSNALLDSYINMLSLYHSNEVLS